MVSTYFMGSFIRSQQGINLSCEDLWTMWGVV